MLQNKIKIKKETAKKNKIKKAIPLTNKTITEGQLCIQKTHVIQTPELLK